MYNDFNFVVKFIWGKREMAKNVVDNDVWELDENWTKQDENKNRRQ